MGLQVTQTQGDYSRGSDPADQVRSIASQTLTHFERTSDSAACALTAGSISLGTIADINTMTSQAVQANLDNINQETRDDLARLVSEPAIARVEVMNEVGETKTIFIVRGAPVLPSGQGYWTASYRSPMGRLAALNIGDELEVGSDRNRTNYRVLNRAHLKPQRFSDGWDAQNTVFESETAGPLTIHSLRAALRVAGGDIDLLDALLAEDSDGTNITEGLIRQVVAKMGLRDQAILDTFQDEIFRLPISSRLAIIGPPGTGKTTTLIRRLGLKLDLTALEGDRQDVARTVAGVEGHPTSWLMFTPSELLKQWVKEAFNREGVPAPDMRIQTWADYRWMLGRQNLGLFRTATSRGAVFRPNWSPIAPETVLDQIAWFEDFSDWQSAYFWEELGQAAARLGQSDDRSIATLGLRIEEMIPKSRGMRVGPALLNVAAEASSVSAVLAGLRDDVEAMTRASLSAQLRADRTLLDQLGQFVSMLGESVDDADDPDIEDDDFEDASARRTDREIAFDAYGRAARAQARAASLKRSVNRRSRNGRILEWLGDRGPTRDASLELGDKLLTMSALQRVSNPIRRYFSGMLTRYRRFRRQRQVEGRWYQEDAVHPADLSPEEADVLILCLLSAGRDALADRRAGAFLHDPRYLALRTIHDLQQNQIVVDEATDFSAIQLSCMALLADPALDSLVLCGDFNQRITSGGIKTDAELDWATPGIDRRPIMITYRQSRPLAELAENLIALSGGAASGAQLPEHLISDGYAPLLCAGQTRAETIAWVAQRIRDIDSHMGGRLPSVAVLVPSEAEVAPIADALNTALEPANIPCVACPNGQVRGHDNEVRVFDVQHIKGLEFEAVFFLDIDQLAQAKPDLFEKYLYVGATRAATYLGLTCTDVPSVLAPLAPTFRMQWVAG